jgi:hypothetical protein
MNAELAVVEYSVLRGPEGRIETCVGGDMSETTSQSRDGS